MVQPHAEHATGFFFDLDAAYLLTSLLNISMDGCE